MCCGAAGSEYYLVLYNHMPKWPQDRAPSIRAIEDTSGRILRYLGRIFRIYMAFWFIFDMVGHRSLIPVWSLDIRGRRYSGRYGLAVVREVVKGYNLCHVFVLICPSSRFNFLFSAGLI